MLTGMIAHTYQKNLRNVHEFLNRTLTYWHPIASCFGVAPRLLTPAGQKLRFWPN